MSDNTFRISRSVDLATAELNYERFRQLAANPHLSPHERIGFPDSYREGFERAIFDDIVAKVPAMNRRNQVIVDVGPGCANLPRMIIERCIANGNRLVLVDSEEMLSQLPDNDGIVKVAGMFPANIEAVTKAAGGKAHGFICYSVLHYLYVDTNLFDVVDVICELLASQGSALVADIPNVSKRKRFFSSDTGRRFHQEFTKTDTLPDVVHQVTERGKIDDAVLAGLIQRVQAAGCDGYIVPQPDTLPMSNRRDDILIRRP